MRGNEKKEGLSYQEKGKEDIAKSHTKKRRRSSRLLKLNSAANEKKEASIIEGGDECSSLGKEGNVKSAMPSGNHSPFHKRRRRYNKKEMAQATKEEASRASTNNSEESKESHQESNVNPSTVAQESVMASGQMIHQTLYQPPVLQPTTHHIGHGGARNVMFISPLYAQTQFAYNRDYKVFHKCVKLIVKIATERHGAIESYKKLFEIEDLNKILHLCLQIKGVSFDNVKSAADILLNIINPKNKQTLLHYFLSGLKVSGVNDNNLVYVEIISFLIDIALQASKVVSFSVPDIFGYSIMQYGYSLGCIGSILAKLQEREEVFNAQNSKIQERFIELCQHSTLKNVQAFFEKHKGITLLYSRDKEDLLPLYSICKMQRYDILKFLLEKGTPIYFYNNYNRNILHIALQYEISKNFIKLLLNLKIEYVTLLNQEDLMHNTPFHYACAARNAEMVKFLLQYTPKLDFRHSYYSSPLLTACYFNNIEVIEFLIMQQKTSNLLETTNSFGFTPFCISILNENAKLVQVLLEAKANVFHQNINGYNVLHFLFEKRNRTAIKFMLKHFMPLFYALLEDKGNISITPFEILIKNNELETMLCLLRNSVDFFEINKESATLMHTIMRYKNFAMAEALLQEILEAGLIVNINVCAFQLNVTLLHVAAFENMYKIASLLNALGINTSITNSQGMTALDVAQHKFEQAKNNFLLHQDGFQRICNSLVPEINNSNKVAMPPTQYLVPSNNTSSTIPVIAQQFQQQFTPPTNFVIASPRHSWPLTEKIVENTQNEEAAVPLQIHRPLPPTSHLPTEALSMEVEGIENTGALINEELDVALKDYCSPVNLNSADSSAARGNTHF